MLSHPIYKLPPELIAAILLCYLAEETNTYKNNTIAFRSDKTRYPRQYSWLKIRHVCRLWRTIALEIPGLNNRVVVGCRDSVEDMLQNSGAVPLHLISGHQTEETEDTIFAYTLAFSCFHRVSSVVLSLTNRLVKLLRRSDVIEGNVASSLETFRATFSNINYRDFRLAPPIFSHVTFPVLRELEIHGGALGLCKPMLSSSLRHLSLRYLDYYVSPDELLTHLRELQSLESLTLWDCLWESHRSQFLGAAGSGPQGLTTFPRLRQLFVVDTQPGCISQLFSHISYPADASVTIGYLFTDPNLSPDMIPHCLTDKLRGNQLLGEMPTITQVTVDNSGTAIRIRLWATCKASEADSGREPAPILEVYSSLEAEIAYILGILSRLSVSHVAHLRISRVLVDASTWTQLLPAFPSLQVLEVEGDGPMEFFSEGLAQAELPRLSCLRCDVSSCVDPVVCLDNLAGTLLRRKEHGKFLHDLVLVDSQCNLDKDRRVCDPSLFSGLARSIRCEAALSVTSSSDS